jgi:hypothetical protein
MSYSTLCLITNLQTVNLRTPETPKKPKIQTHSLCRLIAEYLAAAPVSSVEDAIQTLAGENLLRMMHTHEGAAAASMVIAYGSAKDRKAAVKAMSRKLSTRISH